MKIYSVTDYDTTFVYTTLGWGVEGLSKYLKDCTVKVYPYTDLKEKKILADYGNDVFFIFEIGNPQHSNISTSQLREWYPNAKFITFCSDTIYYQTNGLKWQMDPGGIDLHLEIMPQSLDRFLSNGIDAELWIWTGSERLYKQAYQYYKSHEMNKKYDFIGVYGKHSIENPLCWRHHAVKHIIEKEMTFTNGGGTGYKDDDLDRLFQHYMDSWVTLGTTSHNRPELTRLGCMKGFRDWLGPVLGNVLIYDNHPNVSTFNKDNLVPTYEYDDYNSMTELVKYLKKDKNIYANYMLRQNDWAWDNTIEQQLLNIMLKKFWITKKDIKDEFVYDNSNI